MVLTSSCEYATARTTLLVGSSGEEADANAASQVHEINPASTHPRRHPEPKLEPKHFIYLTI